MSVPKRSRGYMRTSGYFGRYGIHSKELKFHEIAIGAAPTGAGVITASLNVIAQGTGEKQRIGRKCTIRQVLLSGDVQLGSSAVAGTGANRVRMLVYLDKQCNGAAAGVDDVLDTGNGIPLDNFRELSNQARFQILIDKTWALNPTACDSTAATGPLSYRVLVNYRMSKRVNIPLEYSGTNGTIDEIR